MFTQTKKEDLIYCQYCKRWVPYTHVCTYHRSPSRFVYVALSLLLLAALLAPSPTHAAISVPPSPTIGEPAEQISEVYLPITMKGGGND